MVVVVIVVVAVMMVVVVVVLCRDDGGDGASRDVGDCELVRREFESRRPGWEAVAVGPEPPAVSGHRFGRTLRQ